MWYIIDARWTQKGGQNYFGYKNHIKMDRVSKFIKMCFVSAASLHDSQALNCLAEESDKEQSLHADSAYVGQGVILAKWGMVDEICEKGFRNHPLTTEQKVEIYYNVIGRFELPPNYDIPTARNAEEAKALTAKLGVPA